MSFSRVNVEFVGFDVSKEVIETNMARLRSWRNMEFSVQDALECEIPACDLLVCREMVNHLSINDAKVIVERMRTAPCGFFAVSQNAFVRENATDERRTVKIEQAYKYTDWNLLLEPFNLPEPFSEIFESKGRTLAIYKNWNAGAV